MKSRWFYVGVVLLLLGAALLIPKNQQEKNKRVWQHETETNPVEDTNLSIEPETFSTHLPIIVIETNGQEIPGQIGGDIDPNELINTYIQAEMQIIDQKNVLNTLDSEPDVKEKINIRVRGNSSRSYEKLGYLFKFINDDGTEKDLEVLGMEKHSTWVLNASYIDKTQMRNYMWYNLSGEIMEWAPDAKFCEVFLDGEYQGIYTVIEKVSTGEGRIQVTEANDKLAETSYILELDRNSVNTTAWVDSFTFYCGMREYEEQQISIEYPGKMKLTTDMVDTITKEISHFEKAIYSYDYTSKKYGYYNYIDIDSFIDYFLIGEITRNFDMGRYSTYIYKDINGKLKLCVWDFDNCCNNYLPDPFDMTGFSMHVKPWYEMICKDKEFIERVIERYWELREDILSDENIVKKITEIEAYLGCAIDRNYIKWGIVFEPEGDDFASVGRPLASYEEAIAQYTNSLLGRLKWLDVNIDALHAYSHESANKMYNY